MARRGVKRRRKWCNMCILSSPYRMPMQDPRAPAERHVGARRGAWPSPPGSEALGSEGVRVSRKQVRAAGGWPRRRVDRKPPAGIPGSRRTRNSVFDRRGPIHAGGNERLPAPPCRARASPRTAAPRSAPHSPAHARCRRSSARPPFRWRAGAHRRGRRPSRWSCRGPRSSRSQAGRGFGRSGCPWCPRPRSGA